MASPAILTANFSQAIGQTAVQVWPNFPLPNVLLSYMRIYNVSPTATIWCSRAGTAAVNAAGSFPIGPMSFELWVTPGPIPVNALSIISTASSTPVTIEVG